MTEAKAWCWGYNSDGELGDGTTLSREFPKQVTANVNLAKREQRQPSHRHREPRHKNHDRDGDGE